jgi:hypothetical protein
VTEAGASATGQAPETARDGLRLLVFDKTCRGRPLLPGLSHAWSIGASLYRVLGRLDAARGVASWEEALDFVASHRAEEPLAEVQFWGHGKWGQARVGTQCLDIRALRRSDPLRPKLGAVAKRFAAHGDGLWWFRTCETLGARPGHELARDLADHLGARVAGHTFIIGHLQSGLHSLRPGETPCWPDDEGLREGTPSAPKRAFWSRWNRPNTITCLHGRIPAGY